MSIKEKINILGQRILDNPLAYDHYEEILCNYSNGIIPRGLVYEEENRTKNNKGVIIVGLNPGKADVKERQYYKKNFSQYQKIVKYWKERFLFDHPYYKRLRGFADSIGLFGPILWTEIVKCESKKHGILFIKTIREDIHRYLYKEIESTPSDWPIIAVGSKAYEILCYRYLDRKIIGIPHVTGSFGQFARIYSIEKGMNSDIRKSLKKIISSKQPTTVAVKCSKNNCWLE